MASSRAVASTALPVQYLVGGQGDMTPVSKQTSKQSLGTLSWAASDSECTVPILRGHLSEGVHILHTSAPQVTNQRAFISLHVTSDVDMICIKLKKISNHLKF